LKTFTEPVISEHAYYFIGEAIKIISFLIWMKFIGSEVLTTVIMRNSIFWDITKEYSPPSSKDGGDMFL
jgi:hypothetical protein